MTLQPTAGHESAGERLPARPNRTRILYLLLGLLPLSAVVVYAVLEVMASSGASATGGCGGG